MIYTNMNKTRHINNRNMVPKEQQDDVKAAIEKYKGL